MSLARFVSFGILPLSLALFGAAPRSFDFESDAVGTVPKGWIVDKTRLGPGSEWKIQEEAPGSKPNHVLVQTSSAGEKKQFNLCVLTDFTIQDLALSVRVKLQSGRTDFGGGVVWRYQNAQNYYICRWNPDEDNFRVYQVADGKRVQMDTAKVKVDQHAWHTIRVVQVGRDTRCYLDGQLWLEVEDDTFPNAGRVGVWTKSDAVTQFDDFNVQPADMNDLEELK